MAVGATFITWGEPIPGQEQKTLDLFENAIALCNGLVEAGRVHRFRAFFNASGDIREWAGTFIIEGDVGTLRALQFETGMQDLEVRASNTVKNLRVTLAVGGSAEDIRRPLRTYLDGLPPL